MKIALYQNNPVFGEIEKNLQVVLEAVKIHEFDILVLPELFATGYQFLNREEAFKMADEAGCGKTFDGIRRLAADKQALIVYGFPQKKDHQLFNSAIAILPNGDYFIYQKTHLFDTEKNIFDLGQTGFFVFSYNNTAIGMMICFDWRFPESTRRLALLGAQIICHPSNLVMTACPDAMITRAIENMVFTITADRIGTENRDGKTLRFIGRSRIVTPQGIIAAQLDNRTTGFISAEIDPQLAISKAITPNNDLIKDRRPEFY